MNKRYRKQMRLKSGHYRRGHNQFCKCRELWQSVGLALKRRMESGDPLPVRRVRPRPSGPVSPRADESSRAWLPHP